MRYGHHMPMAMGLGACLFSIALTVLAVIVVVKLVKGWRPWEHERVAGLVNRQAAGPKRPHHGPEDPTESALRILNERLAKGEIEIDDYYQRRSALKGPDPLRPEPTPNHGPTDPTVTL